MEQSFSWYQQLRMMNEIRSDAVLGKIGWHRRHSNRLATPLQGESFVLDFHAPGLGKLGWDATV